LHDRAAESHDVKEFNLWRAKTASMLSPQVDRALVSMIVDDLVDSLIENLEVFRTHRSQTMREELRVTIRNAVVLSEEISKSRAILGFSKFTEVNGGRGEYGFNFSDVTMESEEGLEEGQNKMTVELMVAPFFTKAGNADGEEYETETYLVKGSVVCEETRRALEN
jgi:hypothetical protein